MWHVHSVGNGSLRQRAKLLMMTMYPQQNLNELQVEVSIWTRNRRRASQTLHAHVLPQLKKKCTQQLT